MPRQTTRACVVTLLQTCGLRMLGPIGVMKQLWPLSSRLRHTNPGVMLERVNLSRNPLSWGRVFEPCSRHVQLHKKKR
jgi:hypothetical protein